MPLDLSVDHVSGSEWGPLVEHLLRSLWGEFGVVHCERLDVEGRACLAPDGTLEEATGQLSYSPPSTLLGQAGGRYRPSPIIVQLGVVYRERIAATDWTLQVWRSDGPAPMRYTSRVSVSDRARHMVEHGLHWDHIVDTLTQQVAPHIYQLDPRRGGPLYRGSPDPLLPVGLLPLPLFDRPDGTHWYQTKLLVGLVHSSFTHPEVFTEMGGERECQCPYCGSPLLDPTHGVVPVWGGGNLGWVHPSCMVTS